MNEVSYHELTMARLRQAARRYLTGRCTIERETRETGEFGNVVRTWTAVAAEVPCRLIIARRTDLSGSGITGLRETLDCVYRIALPHDADLRIDDRITVDGVIYGVVRMETALTDPLFRQAVLTRREG